MGPWVRGAVCAAVVCQPVCVARAAGVPAQREQTPAVFRAGTDLVVVEARVTDSNKRPIEGLTTDEFTGGDHRSRCSHRSLSGRGVGATCGIPVGSATRPTKSPSDNPALVGHVSVTFAPNEALAALMPDRMIERYDLRSGELNECTATYSNFRQFVVRTQERVPPPRR